VDSKSIPRVNDSTTLRALLRIFCPLDVRRAAARAADADAARSTETMRRPRRGPSGAPALGDDGFPHAALAIEYRRGFVDDVVPRVKYGGYIL
jgi:hypothetical protein